MVNWSNPVFPASPSHWCLIQAPEPAQPSPGAWPFWDTPLPARPYIPSDTSVPVSHAGFIPTLHEQDGKEPFRLPPQEQPKNSSSCKVVLLGFGKVWKTALVKEGTAWLAWAAPQSSSWWSRFCADKPFRRRICQGSAKYIKIEIIYFRSLYLSQIWDFFFFFFSGTVKGTSLTSDWPPCQFSWHCSKPHKH